MKKTFFFPLLLTSVASCGGPSASPEGLARFKELLSQQDDSPSYAKMFVAAFFQDYNAYSSTHGGDDAEMSFYSYRGGGQFGCFYEVDEAAYEEVEALESHDFFDYLARGTGSYGMLQTATSVAYGQDGEKETVSLQSVDFLQRLETYFGQSQVQLYNSLATRRAPEGAYENRQLFNGLIDKETLFGTITARAFSDIIAETNLYDGQRSCETLDRIYADAVAGLQGKSDRELGDFIAKNEIRIEESGENTLVHFKVGDESLREVLDENDIIPGDFEGTLTYEKESGSFSAFEYKIVRVVNEINEHGGIASASMEFKAEGYSWKKRYEENLYIEPNPTVYEDAEAFLDDVLKEVIPPVF